MASISIIIPVWNDTAALGECLGTISRIQGIHEVIVADASSDDSAAALAQSGGAKVVRCDKPNRGRQQNAGAADATGDLLVFHSHLMHRSTDNVSLGRRAAMVYHAALRGTRDVSPSPSGVQDWMQLPSPQEDA